MHTHQFIHWKIVHLIYFYVYSNYAPSDVCCLRPSSLLQKDVVFQRIFAKLFSTSERFFKILWTFEKEHSQGQHCILFDQKVKESYHDYLCPRKRVLRHSVKNMVKNIKGVKNGNKYLCTKMRNAKTQPTFSQLKMVYELLRCFLFLSCCF